jgi:small subunit ribosomal protein S16
LAVRLRLARTGKKKQPHYRIVAADARVPRDGRFLEILGWYDPRNEPSSFQVDLDAVRRWLDRGATPSERVAKLLALAESPAGAGATRPQVSTPAADAASTQPLPVDEAPVDEVPVDEVPVDEAPVDEVPVDASEAETLPTPEAAISEEDTSEAMETEAPPIEASTVEASTETEEAE